MKPENIMWLLLVMFMIHDFEEIVMISGWLRKYQGELRRHFPRLAARVLDTAVKRSTVAFALAVAEEFVLLAIFTMVTVQMNLYQVWTGMLLAYFLHLLMHIGQWIAFRRYTPAIVTSLLTSVYCLYSLWYLGAVVRIKWSRVILPTLICTLIVAVNLPLSLRLADWFEERLSNNARE